jgi:hypothetical protein
VVVQRTYYLTNPCIATLNALDLKICLRASQQIFCQPVGITIRQNIKQLNKEKHFKKLWKIHIYGQVTVYVTFGVVYSNIEHWTTSIPLLVGSPNSKVAVLRNGTTTTIVPLPFR